MSRFKQFTKWMGPHLPLYLIAVAVLFGMQYFRTLPALFIQHIVDFVLMDGASALPGAIARALEAQTVRRELLLVALVALAFAFIRLSLVFVQRVLFSISTERTVHGMRNKLYDHLQNLDYDYHSSIETGDVIQRVTTDVDTFRRFIGEQFVDVLRLLFMMGFAIFQMARMHPTMTWISLATTPILLFTATIYFTRVQHIFRGVEEAEGKMTTTVQENVTGTRVVKAFANEPYELRKFTRTSQDFRDKSMHLTKVMAFFWSSTDMLIFAQYALTASFGIYFTVSGTMMSGQFIAFLSLLGLIVWPLRQLGRIVADFSRTTVALDRIDDIVGIPDEHEGDSLHTPPIEGRVTFESVTFQFKDDNKPLLKNLSFEVDPGETVAVIGRTGSGKSTMMNLMVRLLDVSEGRILLDGTDIRGINKKWLRRHVGIVLQEPFLFSKSMSDNLRIIKRDAPHESIVDAASVARVHEDIENFEEGYETLIGERGVTLSGGQRQRVAIARMLLNRKPVLIFDDSLSAVDTETDLQIRRALAKRWRGTTVFLITHRITTAMEADRIIVLEAGEIQAMGTHDSLLNEDGLYAELYRMQTGGVDIGEGGTDNAGI